MKSGTIRCAVYTRKSTEEGLEQEFNSLDAQYEACAAYIASQRHEGWALARERYDDGGFSGGNIERPGLQRLLDDIASGRIQVIVLYKIDRLTRSLADFAKIVDVLDKAGASFVSITQSFNTTTSMGRLTLNMLLSFAQFEREVTAERIRDKFAASRAKGMWMGGSVPLGYRVQDRKLVVEEADADIVCHIFCRYAELGSGQALLEELREQGIKTKAQRLSDGRIRGGGPFTCGGLFYLLKNRTYIGEVVHKGAVHPGEQEAIIDAVLWDKVQSLIANRTVNRRGRPTIQSRSLLAGRIVDGLDRRMTPSHTVKGGRRYHYYVTHASELTKREPAWRMGARDVEQAVIALACGIFTDRTSIEHMIHARFSDAAAIAMAIDLAPTIVERLGRPDQCRDLIPGIVKKVRLLSGEIEVWIDRVAVLNLLGLQPCSDDDQLLVRRARIAQVRIGKQVKLMLGDGLNLRDDALVALLAEAQAAKAAILEQPGHTIKDVAAATGQCRHRLAKLVKLSWLAPSIVKAIVEGKQPAGLTARELLATDLPPEWTTQRSLLGFA